MEAGEGHGSLKVEGGKAQLQMEARDSREGDPERGSQGFVQEDL